MNTTGKSPAKSAAQLGLAMLAVGLLLAAPGARAQTSPSTADIKFMLAAAQGGMTEVKLGELAAKKGTADDVKEFGQMMVKDHGAMNDSLKALATQKGVPLPTDLDATHQALVDKMAGLPGSEFDDTYVIEMVKAHQNDAKDFRDELAATQDADIQSFLTKSIPIVEAHLKHVGGMQKAAVFPTADPKK